MELERENKRLKVLIIILLVFLVAFGGYYFYEKILSPIKTDESANNTILNNNEVDSSLLNDLYTIVGILPTDQYNRNTCLNKAISTNNYKNNAHEIFSWYAYLHKNDTYHYNDLECQSDEECLKAYSAAASRTISVEDANKIIKLYNFEEDSTNFLKSLSSYDDEYVYMTKIGDPPTCNCSIEHDTDSDYLDSNTIRIIDKQSITEYGLFDESDQIKSQKEQTVIYDFKKNNDNNYYLDNVILK